MIDVYCGNCGKVTRVLESNYIKGSAGGCPYCGMYNLRRIRSVTRMTGSLCCPDVPQTLPINNQ